MSNYSDQIKISSTEIFVAKALGHITYEEMIQLAQILKKNQNTTNNKNLKND